MLLVQCLIWLSYTHDPLRRKHNSSNFIGLRFQGNGNKIASKNKRHTELNETIIISRSDLRKMVRHFVKYRKSK